MTSKRNLDRRLGSLESDGEDARSEVVITDSLVTERGAAPEPFARTRCWRDENGEWHSDGSTSEATSSPRAGYGASVSGSGSDSDSTFRRSGRRC